MAQDKYYQILGVPKTATEAEIKKAYRKMALKWHPDRCAPEDKETAQAKFQEIGQAFEVLSDPEKKKIYDQVGENGMKEGFAGGGGGDGVGDFGFHFGGGAPERRTHFTHSNAEDIFRSFFGTSDPFAADGDGPFGSGGGGGFPFMGPGMRMNVNMGGGGGAPGMGQMGGMGGGGGMPGMVGMGGGGTMPGMGGMGGGGGYPPRQAAAKKTKAPPVNHTLFVTLEDLYSGTTKRMRITSKRIVDASGGTSQVAAEKEIVVKPGWKNGTKITFESEGDEAPGVIPADIVFTLQTKPHDRFERDGDDLIHTCTVDLADALTSVSTTVRTLDNRTLKIDARNVTPDTVKVVTGEGMPNPKKRSRGDLKVKFRIVFPDLSDHQRQQIKTIIEGGTR